MAPPKDAFDTASMDYENPNPDVAPPRFERVYWMREPHLRKLYGLTAILMVASATTGYDGMLLNTSQQIQSWNWFFFPEFEDSKNAKDPVLNSKLGILVNMFNIGSVLSFFITPFVADNYGRKKAILTGCIIMIFGSILTAFSTGYGMYMGGRFMIGFGNSLSQMSSPLLLTEICHPQHRGPVTAVYNCLWNAGALMVTLLALGTTHIVGDWSWRSITFIQLVPSTIQLCGVWFIPESPRYLINKDRHAEALHTLAKWHAGGNVNNATVQFEYREIKETIRIQKDMDRSTKYRDFVTTKGNRWRLAIIVSLGIISQFSGNAIFSNYMNVVYKNSGIGDADEERKLGISAGKILLDLIVTVAAALNVDRFGRRPLFLVSTFGMVGSFACWTVTAAFYEQSEATNQALGYAQLVFIWVFGIFYDIGFSGLLVAYALEVLPFHMRAKGMMIMNITVQAALALGKYASITFSPVIFLSRCCSYKHSVPSQINKLAWDGLPHKWNLMLFYTLWDLCELVFVWFVYVETKGPTLEEVACIFDGKDAIAHIDMDQVQKEIYHGGPADLDNDDYVLRRRRTTDTYP
ncbi:sugar transporter-like protein [Apodospora peruviana]|uniref:Sugar transporter-like protein n=1 Tax=Apodospora peruviana TaxID=516989 RepID=A0AAE0M1G6_9PEZI|nr:sugar transporter-like protein [Apodospora peruviana]